MPWSDAEVQRHHLRRRGGPLLNGPASGHLHHLRRRRLDLAETVSLTEAIVSVVTASIRTLVVDKHCVGGLPGNRTTLLVAKLPIIGHLRPHDQDLLAPSPRRPGRPTSEVRFGISVEHATRGQYTGGCIVNGAAQSSSSPPTTSLSVSSGNSIDSGKGSSSPRSLSRRPLQVSPTRNCDRSARGTTAKVRSAHRGVTPAKRLQGATRHRPLHVFLRVTDGEQPVGRWDRPRPGGPATCWRSCKTPGTPADLRGGALRLAARHPLQKWATPAVSLTPPPRC